MTKESFLDELRAALLGELPEAEIENNIRFYDTYISARSDTGTEEVFEQLGSPRLIAKTIIETYQVSHGPMYSNSSKRDKGYKDLNETDENVFRDDREEEVFGSKDHAYFFNSSNLKWYHKVLLFLAVFLVVLLILFIGGILVRLFFSVGIPVLIVYFIYRLIRGNIRR
jgi:Predicted membrane protein